MLEILNDYYDKGLVYKQTHPIHPLIIWNYTEKVQYEDLWDEVLKTTRGLVTDDKGNIIARPFKKFFNLEESKHTPTEEFEVFTKEDGSLGIIFYYKNEWIIATRGSFTSDQSIKAKEIFDRYIEEYGDNNLNVNLTYLVEIIYPDNRIVVDYGKDEKLILLGITDKHTTETHHSHFEYLWFHKDLIVKKYDGIKDYSVLKRMIKDNEEGFVVRFTNGDRMKIKGEEYLRLHKIMTNLSTTSVWEVLSEGRDVEELIKDVPDEFFKKIKDYEDELNNTFNLLKREYEWIYKVLKRSEGSENRAVFASYAKRYKHPFLLFAMLDDKNVDPLIWKLIKPEFKKL